MENVFVKLVSMKWAMQLVWVHVPKIIIKTKYRGYASFVLMKTIKLSKSVSQFVIRAIFCLTWKNVLNPAQTNIMKMNNKGCEFSAITRMGSIQTAKLSVKLDILFNLWTSAFKNALKNITEMTKARNAYPALNRIRW
jgi:hypothetical protein